MAWLRGASVTLLCVLLLTAGCSDASAQRSTKSPASHHPASRPPAGSYANAAALAKALVAKHIGCADYDDDPHHPDAQSQGRCHVRGVTVVLTVYATDRELDLDVTRLERIRPRKAGSLYLVVGTRWVVNCGVYRAISDVTSERMHGLQRLAAAPAP